MARETCPAIFMTTSSAGPALARPRHAGGSHTRQTDGLGTTRAPPAATSRRPTAWRRCRAGGAHVRERRPSSGEPSADSMVWPLLGGLSQGQVLASQVPTVWFGLYWGDSVWRLARRGASWRKARNSRSEEHTSELQSLRHLVCRLLLEK